MDDLRFKKIELALKAISSLALIVAGVWAFHTYTDTKEKEFYTTYWNKKFELYLETSSWASVMATTKSESEFNEARKQYYRLFYGQLSLVEGESVKKAMENFTRYIPKKEVNELPVKGLENAAYELTIALKEELGLSWKEPFHELNR